MKRLFTALACCIALAGCATDGASPNPPGAQQVSIRAAQALVLATSAFDAANVAAKEAAPHLTPAQARIALNGLTAAREALLLAKAAYDRGDLVTAESQAVSARSLSFVAQQQLIGGPQ